MREVEERARSKDGWIELGGREGGWEGGREGGRVGGREREREGGREGGRGKMNMTAREH